MIGDGIVNKDIRFASQIALLERLYKENLISEQGAKFNGTCYMDEQEQKYETNNIVEISNE